MASVNIFAVLVAGLVPMLIGMVWYSKMGFGNLWMSLIGKTEEEILESAKGKELQMYGGSLVAAMITSFVIAVLTNAWISSAAPSSALMAGLTVGLLGWLGFFATLSLQTVNFESRRPAVWALNAAYNLICLLIMGAIHGLWR